MVTNCAVLVVLTSVNVLDYYRITPRLGKVQAYWNEQIARPREQRAAQGIRYEEVEAGMQPLKAAFESSKEAVTTLGEDEVRLG